jgi:hypothetical protein
MNYGYFYIPIVFAPVSPVFVFSANSRVRPAFGWFRARWGAVKKSKPIDALNRAPKHFFVFPKLNKRNNYVKSKNHCCIRSQRQF